MLVAQRQDTLGGADKGELLGVLTHGHPVTYFINMGLLQFQHG